MELYVCVRHVVRLRAESSSGHMYIVSICLFRPLFLSNVIISNGSTTSTYSRMEKKTCKFCACHSICICTINEAFWKAILTHHRKIEMKFDQRIEQIELTPERFFSPLETTHTFLSILLIAFTPNILRLYAIIARYIPNFNRIFSSSHMPSMVSWRM